MAKLKIDNLYEVEHDECLMYDYLDFNIRINTLPEEYTFNLSNFRKGYYADAFYNFIFSIIEKSNYFLLAEYPKEEVEEYKKNLKHKKISVDTNELLFYLDNKGFIFDISNEEAKRCLTSNLKFNLEEYEGEAPLYELLVKKVDINRDYVANDDDYTHSQYMFFMKNNRILACLQRRSGVIKDYDNCIKKYSDMFICDKIKNLYAIQNDMRLLYDYLDFNIVMGNLNQDEKYTLTNDRIQKYSDIYYDFIKSVIMESNRVIFNCYPKEEINYYLEKIKYDHYNIYNKSRLSYIEENGYIFDISSKEAKDIIIDNLKYNLEEYEDDEPNYDLFVKVIDIDREYVANDERFNHSEYMYFLKNDMVIAGFQRRDGVFSDYSGIVENYKKKYKHE